MSIAICFQDMPGGIPTGTWHSTTTPCSNMPLWVGSQLPTLTKGILIFSVTEDQDVGLLNPVYNVMSHKKARGRRSCSYSSGRLLALGCAQSVLVSLLKPICTSIGPISLAFAVHPITDSSLIDHLVALLKGGW